MNLLKRFLISSYQYCHSKLFFDKMQYFVAYTCKYFQKFDALIRVQDEAQQLFQEINIMSKNSVDNKYQKQLFVQDTSSRGKQQLNSIQPIAPINHDRDIFFEFKEAFNNALCRSGNRQMGQVMVMAIQLTIQEKLIALKKQFTDQFFDQRKDYIIKQVGDNDSQKLFWQNDEGTKCIMLEQQTQSLEKNLTLFDVNFRQIQTVKYRFDKNNIGEPTLITSFTFSKDELFMAMQDQDGDLYFCQLTNGMEHDLFVDQDQGQMSFKQMSHNSFEFKQASRRTELKISKHLYVFDDRKTIYKSKLPFKDLFEGKGKVPKKLSYANDFQRVDNPLNHLVMSGPFAFGINLKKQIIYVYDCDKDIGFSLEIQSDLFENEDEQYLTEHTLIQPTFLNNCFTYYFYVFGKQKLNVFHFENQGLQYDFSLAYPSDFPFKPIKIISTEMILCQDDDDFIQLYQINVDQKKIVFCSKIKALNSAVVDVMKQSTLLYDSNKHQLYNIFKSPLDYHQSIIALSQKPEEEKVIGINCFDEVLSCSDFNEFLKQSCPHFKSPEALNEIVFYSKTLKIVVVDYPSEEQWVVYFLDNPQQLRSEIAVDKGEKIIKSLSISKDQEFIRIFSKNNEKQILTCLTIFQNFRSEKTSFKLEGEESKIQVSENGNKVAILYKTRLQILSVNFKNQFAVIWDQPANDLKFEDFKFLNQVIIFGQKAYRLDIYNVLVEFKQNIVQGSHYLEIGEQWLMVINQSNIYIYDLINSGLKIMIKNKNFDHDIIQNFGKMNPDGVFYSSYKNLQSDQIFLRRVQFYDQANEMICGIPFELAFKDNLTCVFDMKSHIIEYYLTTEESTINAINIVSRLQLKYYFDPLTEYADFDEDNRLLDREKEVIENIQNNPSLLALTSYNVLHCTFYLNSMQKKPEFKRFIPHIIKRLELVHDDEVLPYLMCRDESGRHTPLSKGIEEKDIFITSRILGLLIKVDVQGLMYADYTVQHLVDFKQMGLDLKPFFNSGIPFHKVDQNNKKFVHYHTNHENLFAHSNNITLHQVLNNGNYFSEIETYKDSLQYNIEYYIVNMKEIIGQNTNSSQRKIIQLIDELSDFDFSYLEIDVIKAIIDYKWNTYTWLFYRRQIIIFLLFMAGFIFDIAFLSQTYGLKGDQQFYASLICRGINEFILFYEITYEIRQMCDIGICNYFSTFWNKIDVLLQLVYPGYLYISVYQQSQLYYIKGMQCLIIVLTFMKLLFAFRINKFFGFFIQVIVQVLGDLKQFLLFIVLMVLFFTSFLAILLNDIEDYKDTGPGGYFIIALRQSLGDYDTDNLIKSDYNALIWIVWLLVMFIGNFILKNLIITVVGQSYENCQNQRPALMYKVKLEMIREYEGIMNRCFDLNDKRWFPNFIVVRRALLEGRDVQSGESENGWIGMPKEVQKIVKAEKAALINDQSKVNSRIENEMKQLKRVIGENQERKVETRRLIQELKGILIQK